MKENYNGFGPYIIKIYGKDGKLFKIENDVNFPVAFLERCFLYDEGFCRNIFKSTDYTLWYKTKNHLKGRKFYWPYKTKNGKVKSIKCYIFPEES